MSENIFFIPVRDSFILYSPLSGTTSFVNAAAVREVRGALIGDRNVTRELVELAESLRPTHAAPIVRTGEPLRPIFLGIIPTRACKLACRYCGFGSAEASPERAMPLSTAARAVDWMAENYGKTGETVEFHFFGGEPFDAPEIVTTVVHRARMRGVQLGFIPRFEASTNGCFNHEMRNFIRDHFDTLVLSFDGFDGIQDLQRPWKNGSGTMGTVLDNVRELADSSVELCVRLCVTDESLPSLEENMRRISEEIRPSVIDVEPMKRTLHSDEFGLHPPEPIAFARAFLRSERTDRETRTPMVFAAAEIDKVQRNFCPLGKDAIIVTPAGRINACYLNEEDWTKVGLNLSYGEIQEEVRIAPEAIERIRKATEPRPECIRCFLRWHCAGGCRVENAETVRNAARPTCVQARLIGAGRLLRRLGLESEFESLYSDDAAMNRLADNPSDLIIDWRA